MQSLSFTSTADDKSCPAVGLVVLQTDETMEDELKRWLPDRYRLFHTRIANSQKVDQQTLQAMKAKLPDSVSLLPSNAPFEVIAFGCTSASTLIGEQVVTQAIQSVIGKTTAVTNPVTAIKANLQHIKAKRIALLTPYSPDISQALLSNLSDSGYSITNSGTFNETQDYRVARISRDSLLSAITHLGGGQDIDALVVSCTNLRTFDVVKVASDSIACPVISSNSALAWHIQHLVDEAKHRDFAHTR